MAEVTELGKRVKEWRLQKKLTQVALAHGAGCKETDVQAIENGRRAGPSIQRKLRIFMGSVTEERIAQLRNFRRTPVGKRPGAKRSRYAPPLDGIGISETDEAMDRLLGY